MKKNENGEDTDMTQSLMKVAGLKSSKNKKTELNLQQIDSQTGSLPELTSKFLALQAFFDDGEHPREAERIQKHLTSLNALSWVRNPSKYEEAQDTETLSKAVRIAREVLNK